MDLMVWFLEPGASNIRYLDPPGRSSGGCAQDLNALMEETIPASVRREQDPALAGCFHKLGVLLVECLSLALYIYI